MEINEIIRSLGEADQALVSTHVVIHGLKNAIKDLLNRNAKLSEEKAALELRLERVVATPE